MGSRRKAVRTRGPCCRHYRLLLSPGSRSCPAAPRGRGARHPRGRPPAGHGAKTGGFVCVPASCPPPPAPNTCWHGPYFASAKQWQNIIHPTKRKLYVIFFFFFFFWPRFHSSVPGFWKRRRGEEGVQRALPRGRGGGGGSASRRRTRGHSAIWWPPGRSQAAPRAPGHGPACRGESASSESRAPRGVSFRAERESRGVFKPSHLPKPLREASNAETIPVKIYAQHVILKCPPFLLKPIPFAYFLFLFSYVVISWIHFAVLA